MCDSNRSFNNNSSKNCRRFAFNKDSNSILHCNGFLRGESPRDGSINNSYRGRNSSSKFPGGEKMSEMRKGKPKLKLPV